MTVMTTAMWLVPACAAKIAFAAALTSLSVGCTSCARRGSSQREFLDAESPPARFACTEDHCVDRYPRLPDDGEWTCNDMGGVAVCSGGDPPAGVPFNVSDPAWICGQRQTPVAARADHERVCVDLAPDFPTGTPRGWRCHYTTANGVTRVCDRDANAHVIGDACDARAPCLDGLRCSGGRCTPDPPSPSCILDADCGAGVCRFGSCRRGPT